MITLENEFDENLFAKIPSNATHLLTSIGYGAAIVFEFTIGNQELGVKDFKKVKWTKSWFADYKSLIFSYPTITFRYLNKRFKATRCPETYENSTRQSKLKCLLIRCLDFNENAHFWTHYDWSMNCRIWSKKQTQRRLWVILFSMASHRWNWLFERSICYLQINFRRWRT